MINWELLQLHSFKLTTATAIMEIVIFAEDGTTINLQVRHIMYFNSVHPARSWVSISRAEVHLPTPSTVIRVYVLDAHGLENSLTTIQCKEVGVSI